MRFYKPCSVPSRATIIYLHLRAFSIGSFPLEKCPYQNLGCWFAGFTRSTLDVAIQARLCGTFKGINIPLGCFPSRHRQTKRCMALLFPPSQTLHSSQNVPAWTFLTTTSAARLFKTHGICIQLLKIIYLNCSYCHWIVHLKIEWARVWEVSLCVKGQCVHDHRFR